MRRTYTTWTCENCGKEAVKDHRLAPPDPPEDWLEVGPLERSGYTALCSWTCVMAYAERKEDPPAQ